MPTLLQIAVEGNTGSTGTIAEAIGQLVMNQGWESYIAHGRFHDQVNPILSESVLILILYYMASRLDYLIVIV